VQLIFFSKLHAFQAAAACATQSGQAPP